MSVLHKHTQVSPVDHGDCQELFKQFGSEVTERMTCVTGKHGAGAIGTDGTQGN